MLRFNILMKQPKYSLRGVAGMLMACLLISVFSGSLQAQPKREFRAAWLTTVWAIDWPNPHSQTSASGQALQQQSLLAIVDSLEAANMNAILFQVRGFCDAMYNSHYEPWSKYLTGTRGDAPSYDPLQTLIEYAHNKGIEVHVWMNPYRYSTSADTHGTLPTDYANTHPDWIVDCGGIKILNPCLPAVKERIAAVVADVTRNYDIDGVIFDDYFYQSGYQNSYDDAYYSASGTTLNRADWRRAQVNEMVRMVHDSIKAIKPYVRFGIGPAGVAGTASTSAPVYGVEPCPVGSDWQYNGIYSDPLAWYDQKTIDYMAPQLYWKIGSGNDFAQLSEWWSKMGAHFGRHMYASPTLSSLVPNTATCTSSQYHADEIGNQVQLTRDYDMMGAPGTCLYSLSKGLNTYGFIRYMRNTVNPHPALVPMMSWYRTDTCLYVRNMQLSGNLLRWTAPASNLRYAVYCIPQDSVGEEGIVGSSRYLLGTTYSPSFILPAGQTGLYAVAVLDRYGNEYPARTLGNTTWGNSVAAQLNYPADSAHTLMPTTFSWTSPAGADSYFFQLSRTADFSTIDYEAETIRPEMNSSDLAMLHADSTYYWRVRTRSINKVDTYSEVASFSVKLFSLLSPADDERDVDFRPIIICDSVQAADATYYFEVATANTFKKNEIIWTDTTTIPRCQVADSVLKASSFYFIRVKVTFGNHAAVSNIVKIRTHAIEVPVPEILRPSNGEVIADDKVTVEWREQLSSGFRVELSTSTAFPARQTTIKKTDEYTYSYTYTDVKPGTYYIRVKAVADTGLTDPSEVVMITVTAPTAVTDLPLDKAVKVVENGQVFIYRGGKKFTILGTPAD